MRRKLSIVIPILNEEKNISNLIKKIKKYLKLYDFEIIFVDDNSNDKSKEILKKLKKKYLFFNPILRSNEPDLSKSCFDGIKKSKFENILIMDGDLQHDPKYIPNMYNKYINIVNLKLKAYKVAILQKGMKSVIMNQWLLIVVRCRNVSYKNIFK